ncbi:MAG TPA: lipid-A-disaccharide synthase, partial [Flavobacteriales bacterium]|nr:lipid-A-disaccharide synthase [Flavobacteriales bacterium]
MSKRIYIIAGEASGDLHGGNLVKALFNEAAGSKSELKIRGWGGDRMAAAGADVVKHYSELAFMGFTQVIMNLRSILRNIDACKADIAAF